MLPRRTFAAALDRYLPMRKDNAVAAELVRLLELARPTWDSRVSVTTSMFDLIFTPEGVGPWDVDPMPAGTTWLRVQYETRNQPPVPCFRFELYRIEAHPANPRHLHDFLVSGDIARAENSKDVLDAFLMQLAAG